MSERSVTFLDPGAKEFRPKSRMQQFISTSALVQPQIYNPYHCYSPTVIYEMGYSQPPPAYVSTAATRALQLSLVSPEVTEATVRRELEVFGDVRAVEMGRLGEGIVIVHFYDLRHSQAALVEIQEQHMRQQSRLGQHYCAVMIRNLGGDGVNSGGVGPIPVPEGGRGLIGGQAVWAQFAVPTAKIGGGDGYNQGTIVVFNLDSGVSSSEIQEIFEGFGPVRELRETPLKRQHRFVEFYDVRDAARALSEMNGKELYGKRLVVEFSRPGGNGRRFPTCNTTPSSSNTNNINSQCRRNFKSNYQPPPPPTPPPRLIKRSPNTIFATKKSSPSKESASTSDGRSRIETQRRGDYNNNTSLKRNYRKNNGCQNHHPPSSQSKQSIHRFPSARQHKKQSDSNFLFKEDPMEESICRDSRTTVMIKNIPNKYSQKLLLNMLDNHCIHCNEQIAEGDDEPLSSYDFVYLPIDFFNKCNVGYGFVNLTSPKAAWRLYKSFHLQPWEVFNSRKICQVTYARLQGLEALKEHFKNSKFACDIDEYMPVVFSPPRDGKQLTEPFAIGGNTSTSSSNSMTKVVALESQSSSKKSSDEDDDDPTDGGDSPISNNQIDDEIDPTVELGSSSSSSFSSPSAIVAC